MAFWGAEKDFVYGASATSNAGTFWGPGVSVSFGSGYGAILVPIDWDGTTPPIFNGYAGQGNIEKYGTDTAKLHYNYSSDDYFKDTAPDLYDYYNNNYNNLSTLEKENIWFCATWGYTCESMGGDGINKAYASYALDHNSPAFKAIMNGTSPGTTYGITSSGGRNAVYYDIVKYLEQQGIDPSDALDLIARYGAY